LDLFRVLQDDDDYDSPPIILAVLPGIYEENNRTSESCIIN
jgi:hypothetical protein